MSEPLTAKALQDLIATLPNADGPYRFSRCPKCGDLYNIPTHPENCDGTCRGCEKVYK